MPRASQQPAQILGEQVGSAVWVPPRFLRFFLPPFFPLAVDSPDPSMGTVTALTRPPTRRSRPRREGPVTSARVRVSNWISSMSTPEHRAAVRRDLMTQCGRHYTLALSLPPLVHARA